MRGSSTIVTFAAAAALFASIMAGCKYSNTYPPLPGPQLAPTFAPGVVTEYPVPTSAATPFAIAQGSDGNMWFTELDGNKIGRITPSGTINEIPLPTGGSLPEHIVQGPGGNPDMWFVEAGSNKIGAINEGTLGLSEFNTPTANSGPSGLATDPTNANVMWFGEFTAGQIGKITTSGVITEYSLTGAFPGAQPDGVAVTSDGRVWFLDPARNAVGVLTFPGPLVNEVAIPTAASFPEFIALDPTGNLWFTEGASGNIGRVVTSSNPPTITEFATPSNAQAATVPFGITYSPKDGDMWFAETGVGQVGRITLAGTITEYGIPGSGTTAFGLAPGPDVVSGAATDLWFTDNGVVTGIGTNQVGKINLNLAGASGVYRPGSKLKRGYLTTIPEVGPKMRMR